MSIRNPGDLLQRCCLSLFFHLRACLDFRASWHASPTLCRSMTWPPWHCTVLMETGAQGGGAGSRVVTALHVLTHAFEVLYAVSGCQLGSAVLIPPSSSWKRSFSHAFSSSFKVIRSVWKDLCSGFNSHEPSTTVSFWIMQAGFSKQIKARH